MIRVLEAFPNSSMTSRRGAQAQRRKKAVEHRIFGTFAPLRLCVSIFIALRNGSLK
jgi:hypothetical protein